MNKLSVIAAAVILIGIAFASSLARAQAVCPWLTEGTAATLLGSPVTVAIQIASTTLPTVQGTCQFTTQQGETKVVLEVAVANSSVVTCPAGSERVMGVGDDSLACRMATPKLRQVVSSRVRSVRFSISLTVQPAAAMPEARQAKVVKQIAEQVSGNLF